MAVRRPHDCGDVGHHQRVHDRVERLQVVRPHVEQHALAHQRQLSRPRVPLRGHRHRRVDRRASLLDRAEDRARGVVATHPLQTVQDLAAPVAVDNHNEVDHPRRHVGVVAGVLLLEQPPERGLDLRGRRVLLAPDRPGVHI
jgi:hypothetical protein